MPDRLAELVEDEDRSYIQAKVEVRQDESDATKLEIFIPYDVETDLYYYREVIRPGFFSRAIAEKQDVVAWFQHGEGGQLPLGRTAAGTLELEDTARGLRAIAAPPDRPWVEDLVTSIRRGEVNGASFAFNKVKVRWTEEDDLPPLRELLDGDLWDVSPVVFPAYPKTMTKVRQAAERVFRRWMERRSKAEAEETATINPDEGRESAPTPPEPAVRLDEPSLRRYYCDGEYLAALYGIPKITQGD